MTGDDGGGGGHNGSEEDTPVHSDDGTGYPRKPEDDPNPDGPHGRHSRMCPTMTINNWAKPIPELDLPPRTHTQNQQKNYLRKKILEELFSGPLRQFGVINYAKEFSKKYFLRSYVNFA